MTTRNLEVGDLFSILGAQGIEKQLMRIAGVGRASVNAVSGITTVDYDAAKTNLPAIQAAIKECGYHCAGQALPKHVCEEHATPNQPDAAASPVKSGHAGMAMPGSKPEAAKGHTDHTAGEKDGMASEMGHGAGMDMQAMVRDMRNRFFIALGFSLPIFALSPMGMDFIKVPVPFGLPLDPVLFVLASAAILHPDRKSVV